MYRCVYVVCTLCGVVWCVVGVVGGVVWRCAVVQALTSFRSGVLLALTSFSCGVVHPSFRSVLCCASLFFLYAVVCAVPVPLFSFCGACCIRTSSASFRLSYASLIY